MPDGAGLGTRSAELYERAAHVIPGGVNSPVRAMRAIGRDPIFVASAEGAELRFAGAYHGHVDGLLADAGSGLATQGIPASPGVTEAQARDTLVAPWNDRAAVEHALAERPVAAILCEPYPANMGLVPPVPGFLSFLREAADSAGALLVFDEVISGFRVAPGGAQEREALVPDLTILGKVIGGGLPAAAYAGPVELMERIAPAGDVYQAGTLSGNPLATAAGLATLRLLEPAAYEALDRTTELLARGLERAAADAGVPVQVARTTGLLTVFFSSEPVRDLDGARACDAASHAAFCRGLLERGIYPPPSQFEAWFPSLAHSAEHVERAIEAAREVLASL